MTALKSVYRRTIQNIKANPVLFMPFAVFAAFEFVSLITIYLAPRMPLKLLLGPVIRSLWGEKFLHYPVNFILMPKLVSLARVCLTVFIGSLLTGVATLLVYNIYKGIKIDLKDIFKLALKKYISLFAIVLLFTLLFYLLDKITPKILVKYFSSGHSKLLFLGPKIWLGPILMAFNFTLGVIIQSAFIYAIPVLMIEKESLTKAILKSLILFKKLFLKTLILIGLPMLIYIPISILQTNSAFLIVKLFPESVFLMSTFSLIINALVIDLIITLTATHLYLMHKNE